LALALYKDSGQRMPAAHLTLRHPLKTSTCDERTGQNRQLIKAPIPSHRLMEGQPGETGDPTSTQKPIQCNLFYITMIVCSYEEDFFG
jgi:hypothetical protein